MLARIFITQGKKDKRRYKRNLLHHLDSTFNYASHARKLSIMCENCDLFTTPLTLFLMGFFVYVGITGGTKGGIKNTPWLMCDRNELET